jgi:hypothetical protein
LVILDGVWVGQLVDANVAKSASQR